MADHFDLAAACDGWDADDDDTASETIYDRSNHDMADHFDLAAACGDYLNGWDADDDDTDRVRAVYDAAARILNDDRPVADDIPDLWQLRAAYIDAHAALIGDHNSDHNFYAHAAALRAATTGHTMT
jgi:hypothetical protein